MNRLQSELQRLYLPRLQTPAADGAHASALIDAAGQVRCLVMELQGPPRWEDLAPVWHGVQAELELPAPAIAVSGIDGLQLWFSLAEPISVARAHTFLEYLQSRYLPEVKASRVRLMPALDASASRQQHARLVPAQQQPSGDWSAFIAQDLAPVFAETPWLDIEPSEEGQATLLHALAVTPTAVFQAAWERLALSTEPLQPSALPVPVATVNASADGAPPMSPAIGAAQQAATQFLLHLMHDETVALALRVDAAKALLQHAGGSQLSRGD